ncbi:CAMK/CAMK1 protein kinase [Phytophthora cinnamomi]|uniref:CAMK/CAMK1 protein kinase n=1 Tax=Phytophthora cinnamomi TaxID=4785 RepID=UPI00355A3184|nr:CAMK/CAMK1 protein kinase [Phytophthora cinnamomi]
MMDDVAGFEQAAKKSWQSFSTMRRFVDEATRLENASWRLWFMQCRRAPHGADEPDAEDAGAAGGPRALCVYCELHSASLSCHGCCHDNYCVSCFKLVHKKGNLALHTAVKIHVQHRRHSEREVASSSGASTTCEDADLSTTSKSSVKKSSDGDVEASRGDPSSPQLKTGGTEAGSIFNKPWELQMDMLLQRLMMNSIHSELDISVHNIDARDSLDASDSIATYLSDAEDAVPPLSLGDTSESDEDVREKSNQAVVAAAVAAAGRHRAHSLSFEENAKLRSPVMSPVVIHPSPPGMTSSMEDMKLPVNLFPAGLPRANSRRRNSQTCANCSGNHITIECPLLESALMPPAVTPTPGGSGVDTVLRKCFTTIHNNNMANSTHAFLGDEVSVRGGSNFANMKQWPSSSALQQMDRPSPFGMNVIAEDNLMANEDLAPLLGELAVPNAGGSLHSCRPRNRARRYGGARDFDAESADVMELELMRDGDLHEEIATKSAVDESRASFLVASLVRAIDYCQRNGVAHRDVKLSNLALDYERSTNGKEYAVIKVADFGMAAFIQKDGMLKGRCGTPGFVAPEILSAGKGEAYPSGVDMFSAGVVAYTMLCGYEPFFGVNDEELIQMNKRVDYEFEEPEWASISDEAKDMISLMMEKDAYRRVTPKEALEHPFLREANAVLEDLFREQQPINPSRLL